MHVTVRWGQMSAGEWLSGIGAEVDSRDARGITALDLVPSDDVGLEILDLLKRVPQKIESITKAIALSFPPYSFSNCFILFPYFRTKLENAQSH